MDIVAQNFGPGEEVLLGLRRLYELRGFRRIKAAKFEEYALYIENKNFLDTDNIITFMDVDGKLMALKPDVTLSIVKNIPRGPLPTSQKLYYVDEVYRLSAENRAYKVMGQIGVELIGDGDGCSNLEIIDLAARSLEVIGRPCALDISHLGFVSGLLGEMGLSHRTETQLLENIHAKNAWDAARVLEQAEVPRAQAERVLALFEIHGGFAGALGRVKALVSNDEMRRAYEELARVGAVLQGCGGSAHLDFSVVNDLDYYNGLIFRGYVEGVPSLVLTGGRYDNLMRKMRKESGAIGFAIYLDELGACLKGERQPDFDLLITYPDGCDFAALLDLVRAQNARGVRVRLERASADLSGADYTALRHCRYEGGALEEVPSC